MDIRIRTAFPSHIKTTKLRRRLGADGVLSLLTLWTFAAENKSRGALIGMTEEDVELAAARNGKGAWLCCACTDAGELRRRAGYLPATLRACVLDLARRGVHIEHAEHVLRRCTDDDSQFRIAFEVFQLHREGPRQ